MRESSLNIILRGDAIEQNKYILSVTEITGRNNSRQSEEVRDDTDASETNSVRRFHSRRLYKVCFMRAYGVCVYIYVREARSAHTCDRTCACVRTIDRNVAPERARAQRHCQRAPGGAVCVPSLSTLSAKRISLTSASTDTSLDRLHSRNAPHSRLSHPRKTGESAKNSIRFPVELHFLIHSI